jgi:PAS domain S-box-containing protein
MSMLTGQEFSAGETYARLFQGSRDAIIVVARGVILDANPAAGALLGYEHSELLRLALNDLLVDPNNDAFRVLAESGECRTHLCRKDGGTVYVWITRGGKHTDECGDALIIRDVTATLTLDHRIQQAQKMEAIGRLAGGIAHDFNNLLTAIIGYAELLITNLSPEDPNIQDAYEIRGAGLSAARLTRNLLAISRPQESRTEIVDINAVVSRTGGILKHTLGEDISLSLQLDPALKFVKTDPTHLEQIVLNLAVNARDAMLHGGQLLLKTSMEVVDAGTVDAAPAVEYVRLAVTDTGCGIPEEIRSKIFEPFFTTKGKSGTGLGLATVYGLVKQSGGHIRVDSIEGLGTTFTIDLPSTSETAARPHAPAEDPRFVEGSATVLIVEDDPSVRELTELVLRRAGHDVVAASSPSEALEAFRSRPDINLVLTDVVMPEMNGYALTDQLRQVVPGLRCVFMSGFAGSQPGLPTADPFLAKPFTVASLTAAVQQAIAAVS